MRLWPWHTSLQPSGIWPHNLPIKLVSNVNLIVFSYSTSDSVLKSLQASRVFRQFLKFWNKQRPWTISWREFCTFVWLGFCFVFFHLSGWIPRNTFQQWWRKLHSVCELNLFWGRQKGFSFVKWVKSPSPRMLSPLYRLVIKATSGWARL